MASSFTWLDYSEKDRQIMLELLTDFKEHETRDELGIGVIRDAFSDMFFPGTSTIQTRARYFLFIPWAYRGLEDKKIPSSKIERRARDDEIRLIYALLASGETSGVIGKEAKESLQRLPSSIYWQGLEAWGIRLCPYSISDYHRSLDTFYSLGKDSSHSYEEEIDGYQRRHNWHPGLPTAPDDFPAKASFKLTYDEACYLKERVLARWPDTMLAYLLKFELASEPVRFPWDHPICPDLPEAIQERLLHARNFSEVIYGAALLYNLMLAEKAIESGLQDLESVKSRFEDELMIWSNHIQLRRDELSRWDYQERFWEVVSHQGARPTRRTLQFVKEWVQMALSQIQDRIISENDSARKLIYERERLLKGNLARLDNPEALARWSRDPKTKMAGRIRYRWHPAETIISDILLGLRRS
jgi:hypothetical protein